MHRPKLVWSLTFYLVIVSVECNSKYPKSEERQNKNVNL